MNTRSKTIYIILLAAVILTTGACSRPQPVSSYSPSQIAEAVISAQKNITVLHPLSPEDDYYSEYLTNIYRIDIDIIEDGMIWYSFGMSADEITVFTVADGANVKDIKEGLLAYIGRRAAAFTGYAPNQAAIVENGVVAVHGSYVALLICEDTKGAESVFMACFSNEPPALPGRNALISENAPGNTQKEAADPGDHTEVNTGDGSATDGATAGPAADGSTAGQASEAGIKPAPDPEETADPGAAVDPGTAAGKDAPDSHETPAASKDTDQGAPTEPKPAESPKEKATGQSTEPKTTADPKETEDTKTNDDPEDVCDPAAVLAAWKNGSAAALSGKNKSVYKTCEQVIGLLITEGMTDYEKELALHDWIIDWGSYDTDVNSNSPDAAPDPDNGNPYGLLINRKAICKGFTSTFQLFMDMVGIECISVDGTSMPGDNEHAWNVVWIEGQW